VRTTSTFNSDGEPLDSATPSPSAHPAHACGSPVAILIAASSCFVGCFQAPPKPIATQQYYLECNGLRVPMKKGWDAGATKNGVWLRLTKNPETSIQLVRVKSLTRVKSKPWFRIRNSVVSLSDSKSKTTLVSGHIQDGKGQFYVYGTCPISDLNSFRKDITFFLMNTVSGPYK
jgi:hypothetical protein